MTTLNLSKFKDSKAMPVFVTLSSHCEGINGKIYLIREFYFNILLIVVKLKLLELMTYTFNFLIFKLKVYNFLFLSKN